MTQVGASEDNVGKWQARLNAAQAKGQTAREIAAEYGVSESTVHAWRRRIHGSPQGKAKEPSTSESPAPFAKVQRVSDARYLRGLHDGEGTELLFEVDGIHIRVRPEADVALAGAIVETILRRLR